MRNERRTYGMTATSTSFAWTVYEADDFDVRRITILFDAAPTTHEYLYVYLDAEAGAAYDTVLAAVDPKGATSVLLEDFPHFMAGDKIRIEYANTDTNSIVGTAMVEL